MGNTSPKEKPKKEAQANQVLDSGAGIGGGGGSGSRSTLIIKLTKLQRTVVNQSQESDSVDVQWQGTAYGVFWSGQLLGMVPGNYNERLEPPTSHRANVVELAQEPMNVVIEVAL